jgi:hypothetical protein
MHFGKEQSVMAPSATIYAPAGIVDGWSAQEQLIIANMEATWRQDEKKAISSLEFDVLYTSVTYALEVMTRIGLTYRQKATALMLWRKNGTRLAAAMLRLWVNAHPTAQDKLRRLIANAAKQAEGLSHDRDADGQRDPRVKAYRRLQLAGNIMLPKEEYVELYQSLLQDVAADIH